MAKHIQGYGYLALAMILVGSTVAASKVIAAGLPPFTATALRFAIAFPIFLVLMRCCGVAWPRPGRRDCALLLAQGAAGSIGYTSLLISGLRLTSAADAAVIVGSLPAVSAAISIVALGERPRRLLLAAIALAAAGVLLSALGANAAGTRSWTGNALVFGAVVCEGLFILLNKRLRTAIHPLAMSALMTGIGLAGAAVGALAEQPWTIGLTAAAVSAVVSVAYYAIVPTVCGFVLWYAGSARVSGAEAALFTAFAPISAIFFAAFLLAEDIAMHQMIGMGCVLAAVLLAEIETKKIIR